MKEAGKNNERHILWSIPCRGWRTSFILETGSGPVAGIPPGFECPRVNRPLLGPAFSEGQLGVSAEISLWGALLSHSWVTLDHLGWSDPEQGLFWLHLSRTHMSIEWGKVWVQSLRCSPRGHISEQAQRFFEKTFSTFSYGDSVWRR